MTITASVPSWKEVLKGREPLLTVLLTVEVSAPAAAAAADVVMVPK